jgi:hypothetical protein
MYKTVQLSKRTLVWFPIWLSDAQKFVRFSCFWISGVRYSDVHCSPAMTYKVASFLSKLNIIFFSCLVIQQCDSQAINSSEYSLDSITRQVLYSIGYFYQFTNLFLWNCLFFWQIGRAKFPLSEKIWIFSFVQDPVRRAINGHKH